MGGDERQVFLVERILQCSHPFPFEWLFARTTAELASEGRPGSPGRSKSSRRDAEPRRQRKELLKGFVTRALLPMAVIADDIETPFPDLVGKPVHRMADNHANGASHSNNSEDVATLSSGEASSALGGREAEVTNSLALSAEWDSEPGVVVLFRKVFDELVKECRIAARLVPPLSDQGGITPGNSFLRGDWIVREPDDRSRQLWCARMVEDDVLAGGKFLVMAVASGPGKVAITHLDATKKTDDKDVLTYCTDFAENRSLPKECHFIGLDDDPTWNQELVSASLQHMLRTPGLRNMGSSRDDR